METRMFRVGRMRLWSFHLWLVFTVSSGHPVKAQPSGTDTVRFLEQPTFGPTSELVAQALSQSCLLEAKSENRVTENQ